MLYIVDKHGHDVKIILVISIFKRRYAYNSPKSVNWLWPLLGLYKWPAFHSIGQW